ncbi:MAG: nuclear transport factor 2 family protein [Acidimicrobiales bacterium]
MPSDDRDEFAALLDQWASAIVANDTDWINQFVTPDWVFVAPTGIDPGTQFLAFVASGELTHETMSFDVGRVARFGDVAVVTSRGVNRGAFRGAAFEADEWTTDVFVRDGDRWRCAYTHLTPVAPARADDPLEARPTP